MIYGTNDKKTGKLEFETGRIITLNQAELKEFKIKQQQWIYDAITKYCSKEEIDFDISTFYDLYDWSI
jgi:hypothetical protein